MVNDLIAETTARIAASGVRHRRRRPPRPVGRWSGSPTAMRVEERDLKRFMYANLYHHPVQLAAADGGPRGRRRAVRRLPGRSRRRCPRNGATGYPRMAVARNRHIGDFIAGMTDRYAVTRYRELVGPIDLPEGF